MKKIIVTILCLFCIYLFIEYSASLLSKRGQVIVEEVFNFIKIISAIIAVRSACKYWKYTNPIMIGASIFFCGGLAWAAIQHAFSIFHTGYVIDILNDLKFNVIGAGLALLIQSYIINNAWKGINKKCNQS